MTKLSSKVIDSWAMVAWVADEPAASAMEVFLEKAETGELKLIMSMLNVGETFYTLAKRRSLEVAEQFLKSLSTLPVHIDMPDKEGVMRAARVKASHRVAYGDSFAIALAQTEGSSVITVDKEILECGLVPVDWIGITSPIAS